MDPLTVQIVGAVGIALVAIVIGIVIGRSTGRARKASDLADELEKTKEEFETYRGEVVQQFADTAGKFRRLNESYGDLHKQLATSAAVLCADRADDILLALPDASSGSVAEAEAGAVIDVDDEAVADAAAETAVTSPVVESAAPADGEDRVATEQEADISDVEVQLGEEAADDLAQEIAEAAAAEKNRTAS